VKVVCVYSYGVSCIRLLVPPLQEHFLSDSEPVSPSREPCGSEFLTPAAGAVPAS